jgi:drug/metabolite transporter (DMT)-like permease
MSAGSQNERHTHHGRGILLRCLSVACFATMSACLKYASADGVSAIEMLFYRSLFGMPVVLIWLTLGPGIGAIRTRRPGAHLIRSLIGLTGILTYFNALILLPLADAATIGFTAPILATILSALVLREKVGIHRWGAVLLGFIGVAIVVRPGGDALSHTGIMFALLSALGTAGVAITIRQIGGTEHPGAIVFWFFFVCAIVSGIGMIFYGHAHGGMTTIILIIAAIFGASAQLLMTMSLRVAPISVVAPFDYTQIIWASLLGWVVWASVPTMNTLAGAALISASGLYTALRERRLHLERLASTLPIE